MEMREAAERIFFAQSLEEKLELPPEWQQGVGDDSPGAAIALPDAPGRPDYLTMSAKGVRASFPGVNKLDDDHERGKMLHFLANHELLAAELMALVLLRFPNAPKEYRRGVYEAMREEQMHTRMYLRRMKDCGIEFGDLPLNDYFWKLVSPMETPMDFVTRLNLTFEQANLDFSKHYATLFRQVGDTGTAAVLEKIYLDEIGHVGHGVKWFRKWKQEGETDWHAFKTSLTFPLAPAKAKGMAPFNAGGRRLAGLDDDFISHLEVCEQSRGRTPVVHWFNPNAESHVVASRTGNRFQPNRMESAMENDLEMLTLAWSRKDDIAVLREHPGNEHLAYLKQRGFDLPEIVSIGQLAGRKLGGMRPWAWSPDASLQFEKHAKQVSGNVPWQWREPLPPLYFSKEIGWRLENKMAEGSLTSLSTSSRFCSDMDAVQLAIEALSRISSDGLLFKAAHACAGRGHKRIKAGEPIPIEWLSETLEKHGGVVLEPWLDRVHDFSVLYEKKVDRIDLIGMTHMENDPSGRFLGSAVYPKWGSGLAPEVAEFLFREAEMTSFYREKLPQALRELLPNYLGPIGIDAFVFCHADGSLGLRPVVELNARMTMGRVALELHKKTDSARPGRFRILRKKGLDVDKLFANYSQDTHKKSTLINNPFTAREFIAQWQTID
ncbi:MAG: DUF455 family protein [Akkermansiaceae bacterium]